MRVIVMVASAGGITAVGDILGGLPADFPAPIAVVQHRSPHPAGNLAAVLRRRTILRVKDAEHYDRLVPSSVFLAPADHHLVVEDGLLMLSQGEGVNGTRPAGDVLFESASTVYRTSLIAVVLTGGGKDGRAGVHAVKAEGGTVIVQNPETSEAQSMPQEAISTGLVDFVLPLDQIAGQLVALTKV